MIGSEATLPSCTHKHRKNKKNKKNKKKGVETSPPPPLLAMAGSKASPPNCAHKHPKKKHLVMASPMMPKSIEKNKTKQKKRRS
jgi:hypothetical protein